MITGIKIPVIRPNPDCDNYLCEYAFKKERIDKSCLIYMYGGYYHIDKGLNDIKRDEFLVRLPDSISPAEKPKFLKMMVNILNILKFARIDVIAISNDTFDSFRKFKEYYDNYYGKYLFK